MLEYFFKKYCVMNIFNYVDNEIWLKNNNEFDIKKGF